MDSTNPPHEAVLQAVAQARGLDPIELDEPLYDAIDPDALDKLVESSDEVTVTFRYCGCVVTVCDSVVVKAEIDPEGRASAGHTATVY